MDREQDMAPALAALTEAQRQEAMARFVVLRSHLNEGIPLSEVARTAGVPLRSVQRWLARYRAAGLVGLARAQRSDTGQRKLPAELVQVIEGMALKNAWRVILSFTAGSASRITTVRCKMTSSPLC